MDATEDTARAEETPKVRQGRRNRYLILNAFVCATAMAAGMRSDPAAALLLPALILFVGAVAGTFAYVLLHRSLSEFGPRVLLQPPVLFAGILVFPIVLFALASHFLLTPIRSISELQTTPGAGFHAKPRPEGRLRRSRGAVSRLVLAKRKRVSDDDRDDDAI